MQDYYIPIRKRKIFKYECGQVFGRLTYTGKTFTKIIHGHWVRYIEAVCICGVVRDYVFHRVACGDTKSCGCLRKDVARKQMTTHGLTNHLLYDVHTKMMLRCYDKNQKQYKDYGGRGIEVWEDWKDFYTFYTWCIENGYEKGKSIDRKENDGFYAPYNCQFLTAAEQNRNTRRNRFFEAFGEVKCLFDWGNDERCVVTAFGLRSRMDRGKWEGNFEGALTTPLIDRKESSQKKKNNKYYTAFGETKCRSAWLEDERCLVKIDSLRGRLAKGWDAEKAMSTPPPEYVIKLKNSGYYDCPEN